MFEVHTTLFKVIQGMNGKLPFSLMYMPINFQHMANEMFWSYLDLSSLRLNCFLQLKQRMNCLWTSNVNEVFKAWNECLNIFPFHFMLMNTSPSSWKLMNMIFSFKVSRHRSEMIVNCINFTFIDGTWSYKNRSIDSWK